MRQLNIGIIGAGVVGMATAGMLVRFGHEVTIWDIDEDLRKELREEGWQVSKKELNHADVIFICTGEKAVNDVFKEFAHFWVEKADTLIVVRSTVPPGTCKSLQDDTGVHVSHNPEFLREAVASFEAMNPTRIILGVCCEDHYLVLREIYGPFNAQIVKTDPATSEMVKLATNAYLSTSISFWNEIKQICDKISVNSHRVGVIASLDPRIPSYGAHMHGDPFISTCLNKDLKTLAEIADEVIPKSILLKSVEDVNTLLAEDLGIDIEEAIGRLRKK